MKYGSHLIFCCFWDVFENARHRYFADPAIAKKIASEIEQHARDIGLIPMAVAVQPDHIHIYVRWNLSTPRDHWRTWQEAMQGLMKHVNTVTHQINPSIPENDKILSWYHFREVKDAYYSQTVKNYINKQAAWYLC